MKKVRNSFLFFFLFSLLSFSLLSFSLKDYEWNENVNYLGFLTCLENLTVVGEVSKKQFLGNLEKKIFFFFPSTILKWIIWLNYWIYFWLDNFKIIQKHGEHFTIVVEDISKKKIVACGSVVVEHKFTHGCGRIGHIEDIVCSEEYRGKHLGKW